MPRRLCLLITAALAASAVTAAGPGDAGELGYSDVDPFDIQMMIYSDNPAEATEAAKKAIAGLRPTDDPLIMRRIGEVLAYLCEAHAELGEYAQAEAACLEAVATFEKVAEVDAVGEIYNHRLALPRLALVYESQHKYDKALAVLEQQLERVKPIQGDGQAANLLRAIGDMQLAVGRFREAESAYREAISASDKAWSRDPWSVTTIYVNLSLLYRLEERFDRAEATVKDGIAEAERSLAGRAKRNASPALEKLQALTVPVLSHWLGWVYFEQERYSEAREAAEHFAEHLESEGEAYSWMTSAASVLLARIEDAEHPGSLESRRYLISASLVPDDDIPATHLVAAVARSAFARHHLLSADFFAAEPLAREASESLTWLLGETHFETARAKVLLARALRGQGKHQEALPFALGAYLAQHQVLPPYHRETGETLALLIELYEALDRRQDLAATQELIKQHSAARRKFEQESR
jgi:tetratricopeptide (TPR) repeat protein